VGARSRSDTWASSRPGPASRMSQRARMLLLFAAFLWLVIEAVSFAGLWVLKNRSGVVYDPRVERLSETQREHLGNFIERGHGEHVSQDPVLGWTPKGNSAGMRDDVEHEKEPADGVLRIAAFGDSFTYGANVEIPETWAKQISEIDPTIEVLNWGSGGYGLDQAYLRYQRRGREYAPHIVFIGYMTENISRNVNVFRAFYTRWYRGVIFTKPRFVVRDSADGAGGERELVLLENPISSIDDHRRLLEHDATVLTELGANDYHYQTGYARGPLDFLPSVRLARIVLWVLRVKFIDPIIRFDGMYEPDSEAYGVTTAIFDAFYRDVLEGGALPVIVIFPDLHDQRRSRAAEERRYRPLLDRFADEDYRVIDTLDALEPHADRYSIADLTRDWGHYSAIGNRLVAEHIVERLDAWGLDEPARVATALREEQVRLGIDTTQ